jgi:hypothetical protein
MNQLAKEAYEAYANHTGWKSLATGASLPHWDQLSLEIQRAWNISTAWVVGKASGAHDWQIPIKDSVFADRINSECMTGDDECDHEKADELLCDLLKSIGCNKAVQAFDQVGKRYA